MHNAPHWNILLGLFALGFIATFYEGWKRGGGKIDASLLIRNAIYVYAPLVALLGMRAYTDLNIVPYAILLAGVYLFIAVDDARRRKKKREQV